MRGTEYPDQFIIADAKRGDIGNTSKLYARTFFEEMLPESEPMKYNNRWRKSSSSMEWPDY